MTVRRFNTIEKISLSTSALIFLGVLVLYLNELFGSDIDGVNPLIFVLGLGASAILLLIPLAVSSTRRRSAQRAR